MKILSGHLTSKDKQAIKAILSAGLNAGKVGKKTYFLSLNENVYTVKYQQKDRGLIPTAGSQLRTSTYSSDFII